MLHKNVMCVCVCRCVCRCSDLSEDTEGCVAELRLADSVQSTLNDGHHSMHVETRHDPWELERIQPAFVGNESCDADSTKVQTFGAISESINETRRSLHRSYSMGYGPTRCIPVISRRLAASAGKPDCTYAFPRCAGQAKGKVKEASSGQRYAGSRPMVRTRMLTPLIDGLGRATWSLTMQVTRSRTPSF